MGKCPSLGRKMRVRAACEQGYSWKMGSEDKSKRGREGWIHPSAALRRRRQRRPNVIVVLFFLFFLGMLNEGKLAHLYDVLEET